MGLLSSVLRMFRGRRSEEEPTPEPVPERTPTIPAPPVRLVSPPSVPPQPEAPTPLSVVPEPPPPASSREPLSVVPVSVPRLAAVPPAETRLSPHFTLEELTRSTKAREHGVDNTPPPEIVERLRVTAEKLERVRSLLGDQPIQITSGFRTQRVNDLVNGALHSDHLEGWSVDFRCPGFGSPYRVAKAIAASDLMAEVDQLIHEYGRWVHISFDPRRRGETLTAHWVYERDRKTTRYSRGIHTVDANGFLNARVT